MIHQNQNYERALLYPVMIVRLQKLVAWRAPIASRFQMEVILRLLEPITMTAETVTRLTG